MAGVKGRSGRTSGLTNADVEQRHRVMRKAWAILEGALDDANVTMREKIEIASKLCPKQIPTELVGDLGLQLQAMGTIMIDGKKAEFNIGSNTAEDTQPPA